MEHRFLGRSGLQVSELCLGTMMFGSETGEQTSHQILDAFADAGDTFIDTADVYGHDRSEEILCRWLAAADWSLTSEQADRLTEASELETLPYPYGLLTRFVQR
jgi:aryl-alcohol dehydrogenase-like predicted oxidoreductase